MVNQRRAFGLLSALVFALVGACETVPLDVQPETDDVAAAQSEQPRVAPAPDATVLTGPLGELTPLSVGMDGVTEAEVFRGTGVLTRRLAPEPLDVIIRDDGQVTLNFANAEIREVVDVVLGETLGVSYIIDPNV